MAEILDTATLFDSLLDDIRELSTQQLQTVGRLAVELVKSRTIKGTDVSGAAFQSYTESYAKIRQKLGKQTAHVDLTLSGEMLDSLYSVSTSDNEIYVGATDPKAAWHNEGLEVPKREFMGEAEEDLDKLENLVADIIEQRFLKVK